MELEPIQIKANNFQDDRGEFSPFEIKKVFPDFKLLQVNTVFNNRPYTFRGLHWQEPPYDQTKIIRCVSGRIIDFVMDIRQGSPNYGQLYGFILDNSDTWLYVPRGFAHGYVTIPALLRDTVPNIVEYLIDNEYNKESERGLDFAGHLNDLLKEEVKEDFELIVNDRDLHWPTLNEINTAFKYEPEEQ